MTPIDASLDVGRSPVTATANELSVWLLERALPLWDDHGVDRVGGGFFESLSAAGVDEAPIGAGDVRRGRVVARQLYVFDLGQRLGWRPRSESILSHGCEYLFTRFHRGDGLWHTAVDSATHRPVAPFSLYEQAFYLFALARVHRAMGDRFATLACAERSLIRLQEKFGRRLGGFEESSPPSLPLKSNPHMHLFEAALAWIDTTCGAAQERWIGLARQIAGLCLTKFRVGSQGAVREYFDYQWQPAAGDDGRRVEPGHQFEWAWLLLTWADSAHVTGAERGECESAALQLIDLGERFGVDPQRGVAVNEIWDDMRLKDADAKLWPQTERVKAWSAMLKRARSPAQIDDACRHLERAAAGMQKYLRRDVPGLWREVCRADGTLPEGDTRASSLYHIACAIDVMRSAVAAPGPA